MDKISINVQCLPTEQLLIKCQSVGVILNIQQYTGVYEQIKLSLER